ncbi:hypothetical protein [Blastococcus atacamensis]|uniref:hypothetical protein n=1 Tax=Blastococcus atacamensis TaxID=2070508 RepID=UPI000CEBB355|nr:hypothetical protein [Blastococcus atacamensis]
MTQANRPYGGANERPDDPDTLPGETSEPGEVTAAPETTPRAAQGGGMSDDVTRVPESGADSKAAGGPDATGPTG